MNTTPSGLNNVMNNIINNNISPSGLCLHTKNQLAVFFTPFTLSTNLNAIPQK
jgi:hypothetical protein